MPRLQRLTDFIARLLGKEWDVRALDRRRSSGPVDSQSRPDEPPTISPYVTGHVEPSASEESADSTTPAGSSGPSEPARTTASAQSLDASRSWSSTSGRSEEEPAAKGPGADRSSGLEPADEEPPASQRDEIAASVNDWNRDKFFPTVGVVDTPIGPLVRATYLTDLSAGATDAQLRLHLDTALSACTQALSLVGPLLPEI